MGNYNNELITQIQKILYPALLDLIEINLLQD
ncbi:MAG: hypothetical protein K0S74_562 [Chlamydiales bacterium]|jgi:hypothetical protein|nr:hypothetical protein [Chlamydiales bacterium]